jgi:hypothetical protein
MILRSSSTDPKKGPTMELTEVVRVGEAVFSLAEDTRDDEFIVGVIGFPDTGEIREQIVKRDAVLRVRRSTVERRMERIPADDLTPHMVVG